MEASVASRNGAQGTAAQRESYWQWTIHPLLEACLNAKDFDKANEIYFDISSRPVFERETKQAVEMAKSQKYEFPTPPADYKALESQTESFIGDPIVGNSTRVRIQPNKLKDIARKGSLHLLVVSPSVMEADNQAPPTAPENNQGQYSTPSGNSQTFSSSSGSSASSGSPVQPTPPDNNASQPGVPYSIQLSNHIQGVLSQDKLPEYRIFPYIMNPNQVLAVELIQQEGFSSNAFIWGILDDDAKYHHGGYSLPTPDNIMGLLDSMRRKTRLDVFREFARNNRESITAKIILLAELSRLGNMRTPNAKMGADGFLEGSADQELWGEYVNIANSVIPQMAMHTMEFETTICFPLPFMKNSRQLQTLAMRQIDAIENALRARPHARELWRLWGTFGPYAPNRSLPSFLAGITPAPDLPNMPPTFLYPELINNYKSLEAWRQVINLVEPIWESYQRMIDSGENIRHRLTRIVLEQYVNPLCEAYTKMGQEQKAEKIRSDWKKAEGWSQ